MIIVDQNIPFGTEAFADLGDILRLPGREIRREHLATATALIVRSITRVDKALLDGTPVRFVGTCTIGTDHLDLPWLESQGIEWTSAPGCNARSVAEYVVAAVALAHRRGRLDLSLRPCAGVIGAGRVGTQVEKILRSLGLEVRRNDPPRAESEGPDGFSDLDELIATSQVVCAHLPLTSSGAHPTRGLLTWQHLHRLPPGALFLNAGRGSTAPTADLLRLADARPDVTLVLDVWDPEPSFPVALASRCMVGTPHIAGYSFEGKVEGTRMVRARMGDCLGLPPWAPPPSLAPPLEWSPRTGESRSPTDLLADLILSAYDIAGDAARLRALEVLGDQERGPSFDGLRRDYPQRREFASRAISGWHHLPESIRGIASDIGFQPFREYPIPSR